MIKTTNRVGMECLRIQTPMGESACIQLAPTETDLHQLHFTAPLQSCTCTWARFQACLWWVAEMVSDGAACPYSPFCFGCMYGSWFTLLCLLLFGWRLLHFYRFERVVEKSSFVFDIITTMDSNRYCNIFIDGTCRSWISRVLTYIVSTLECEIGLCLDRDISDELLFI